MTVQFSINSRARTSVQEGRGKNLPGQQKERKQLHNVQICLVDAKSKLALAGIGTARFISLLNKENIGAPLLLLLLRCVCVCVHIQIEKGKICLGKHHKSSLFSFLLHPLLSFSLLSAVYFTRQDITG